MKITMLETRRGTEDGFLVRRYHEGETYEVTHALAVVFLRQGWARVAEE